MTDPDAREFRRLLIKYSFHGLVHELLKIAQSYSAWGSRWDIVTKQLKGVMLVVNQPIREDEHDIDSNESGAPIRNKAYQRR